MESVVLRAKLGLFEDALTAVLMDLLEDLGNTGLVRDLLARAWAVDADGRVTGRPPAIEFQRFQIDLWPRSPAGEPDAVLTLERSGVAFQRIVVEAKYQSGKSGEDQGDKDAPRDQLARYWLGYATDGSGIPVTLIYLTASPAPPVEELRDTMASLQKHAGALVMDGAIRWFSWRDADDVLRAAQRGLDGIAARRVARVRRLLAHAGLSVFEGWRPCAEEVALIGTASRQPWLGKRPPWDHRRAPPYLCSPPTDNVQHWIANRLAPEGGLA